MNGIGIGLVELLLCGGVFALGAVAVIMMVQRERKR
jgi:hypothetical protein